MQTLIGCSGYYYREWKGKFYPQEMPASQWLRHYATQFNSIEINSTFYKMPTVKSLSKWYTETGEDFTFTVKAPKLFTHLKRMNGILEEQAQFYDTLFTALRDKLQCVLYQFPASVKYSEAMLETLMTLANTPVLHAIEFRDSSWWQPDVYHALQGAGIVFVNVSFPGLEDVFVPNDNTVYLRFHGKLVLYKSAYGESGLQWWTDALKAAPPQQLIAYFNNTWYGDAIDDARMLDAALR